MRDTKLDEMPRVNHESLSGILAFEVAEQPFGVLLGYVVEVLRAVAVTKILKAPPAVEGIVNLRGTVVPVLDVRTRFGLPPKPARPADRMIVVRAKQRQAILRVDRTIDIINPGPSDFDRGKAASSDHAKGAVKLSDGLLLIYDVDSFLSDTDAKLFDIALAGEAKA
jgi:purine-binding chemotaxis protein CheW